MSAIEASPGPITITSETPLTPSAAGADAAGGRNRHRVTLDEYGTRRLLGTDVRVGLLLLTEARHRVAARLFGASRDDSLLLTVIGFAAVASAMSTKAETIKSSPSVGDMAMGAAVAKATVHGIAGGLLGETPYAGTLVVSALLWHHFRPAVSGSLRDVKAFEQKSKSLFSGRYTRRGKR